MTGVMKEMVVEEEGEPSSFSFLFVFSFFL